MFCLISGCHLGVHFFLCLLRPNFYVGCVCGLLLPTKPTNRHQRQGKQQYLFNRSALGQIHHSLSCQDAPSKMRYRLSGLYFENTKKAINKFDVCIQSFVKNVISVHASLLHISTLVVVICPKKNPPMRRNGYMGGFLH